MKKIKSYFVIKVYLKSQKKPLKLIVDKKDQIDEFFDKIQTEINLVRFGNFIFDKLDFLCAIWEKKNKIF